VVAKNVAYFLFNSWLSFRRFCRLLWGYIVVKVIIGYHTAKTMKNQLHNGLFKPGQRGKVSISVAFGTSALLE